MAGSASNTDGEHDLAILYPERTDTIADQRVVMRELSFTESLEHGRAIQALVDAMTNVALDGTLHDLDSLRGVLSAQRTNLQTLIAVCSDLPLAWVATLSATEGERLLLLWWSVNADFFLTRVLLSVQARKLRAIGTPAGPTSSPRSSPPDTTVTASAITPVAN
jgi:hypothetical protein